MTTAPPPEDRKAGLHDAHLYALRAGPFLVALIGIVLVGLGAFLDKPEAVSITMLVLGAAMVVTGGVLPRVNTLKLGTAGVELGDMTSILMLDRDEVGYKRRITQASAGDPASPETPTFGTVLAAASAARWSVAKASGSSHLTLTKTMLPQSGRFNLGDSVTVNVPVDRLEAPVPVELWATLQAAGLALPPSTPS